MNTSKNNWYKWSYDDNEFARSTPGDTFRTHFSKLSRSPLSLKEELKRSAISTIELYPNLTPCIFFSGGVDSEVILRTYIEINSKPEVFIFRYENDINLYDVSYSITICNHLDIKYNLINFDLKKFYETEAEGIAEKSQIDRPRALPQLKFMDYCDGLPIYGASDLSLSRLDDDYSKKSTWIINCWEHDIGWSKYARYINRPAIMEWYKWTPELVAAYLNTEWCKKLLNDEFYGKLGTNSTKILGYREAYPDLFNRKKMTGFENNSDTLINEFENFLIKKNNGLLYRRCYSRPVHDLKKELGY